MRVVATAGHVDHGKSSLIRALTGIDPDRLREEQERGMTIDLGFAWLKLPNGQEVSVVDVPGHERFIHNMLAGVAGIDFALLVVAADDGVMPQTREHLAILDLLGIARGAVALTKIDRVPPERVAQVADEIDALLAPTALAQAPVFQLSPVTGAGIEALRAHLDEVSHTINQIRAGGNFRLSVDRCFTIAGAGLVVTGTAMSGEVTVGSEVRALLAGTSARVRSIHAHNRPAARGRAGERLALNLAGLDGKAPIARGDWIVAGNVPPPARKLDVRLKVASEPLKHWTPVHVHIGAADVLGRVALLDDADLAQLALERPVGAVRGDRFIVRDQSARRTLGGGTVIDVFPPARGRAKPERLAWLKSMELGDETRALEALLALSPAGVDLARYSANRNLPAAIGWRFADDHWRALREKALAALAQCHERHPDAAGPAEEQLPGMRIAPDARRALVDELVHEGAIVREGGALRLASHRPQIGSADAALWQKIEPLLAVPRPPSIAA